TLFPYTTLFRSERDAVKPRQLTEPANWRHRSRRTYLCESGDIRVFMSRLFKSYGPAAWFTVAAAVILLCIYAAVWATPAAGLVHDDGIYIATAKAMASGDGYVMPNLPGSPLQTKFPPLFSFLLSVLWRLNPNFPDNVRLLKIIPVAG